jgi:hypothetical protein
MRPRATCEIAVLWPDINDLASLRPGTSTITTENLTGEVRANNSGTVALPLPLPSSVAAQG